MSVETQLKHVFPFRVLDWKTTFVHGCALFLPHGRVCAVHTTRPTRSRLRFVNSPVRDTTPVRAGVCPRVCLRGPGSPAYRPVDHASCVDAPASSAREERDSPLVTMSSY